MNKKNNSRSYLATLLGTFWIWAAPIHAQTLTEDFSDLFERCRVSIETNAEFNSAGLEMRDVPERDARDWGVDSEQKAWASPESEFYVLLTEWTSRDDGTVRHLCDIRLAEEQRVLEPSEQALLLRHFMIRQVELISNGTHEKDSRLSTIWPIVNAAFMLSDRNANGCVVNNDFAFTPNGDFFAAGSGEKVRPCHAP